MDAKINEMNILPRVGRHENPTLPFRVNGRATSTIEINFQGAPLAV
jgi:hypothetical protein